MLVDRLFDCCNSSERADGKQMVVFLDRRSLQDGDPLQASFMKAMASAHIIVPIVSAAGVKRMESLTPDSPCDNLQLEWSVSKRLNPR